MPIKKARRPSLREGAAGRSMGAVPPDFAPAVTVRTLFSVTGKAVAACRWAGPHRSAATFRILRRSLAPDGCSLGAGKMRTPPRHRVFDIPVILPQGSGVCQAAGGAVLRVPAENGSGRQPGRPAGPARRPRRGRLAAAKPPRAAARVGAFRRSYSQGASPGGESSSSRACSALRAMASRRASTLSNRRSGRRK